MWARWMGIVSLSQPFNPNLLWVVCGVRTDSTTYFPVTCSEGIQGLGECGLLGRSVEEKAHCTFSLDDTEGRKVSGAFLLCALMWVQNNHGFHQHQECDPTDFPLQIMVETQTDRKCYYYHHLKTAWQKYYNFFWAIHESGRYDLQNVFKYVQLAEIFISLNVFLRNIQ